MKYEKNDFIYIGLIVAFLLYVIFGSIWRNKMEKDVIKNGTFSYGIIIDDFIGMQNVRSFTCIINVKDSLVKQTYDVTKEYFNQHKIGDTIIIKYLPNEPKKNIIIEDKEYKSCYGLPPKEGWGKLSNCD